MRDADVGAKVVIDHCDADALCDQGRRDEGVISLIQCAPVTAVDEQQRTARLRGGEQIDRLPGSAAVAEVQAALETRAGGFAVRGPASEPLRMIGKSSPQIVFALDE